MKYLSSLLPVILLAACNQSPDKNSYDHYLDTQSDTISSATNAVIEMSQQASTDSRVREKNKDNIWRYDVPMPGNTYSNTRSASLKAYDANAYLKLVNGKDINMAALLLDDERFYEGKSQQQDIKVTFDSEAAIIYTCSLEPIFGFLIIDQREEFIQKLKKSHTVMIEAVSKKIVTRKEIRYPNGKSASSYYSSSRRRRRLSSPTETIKTETKLTNQTWVVTRKEIKYANGTSASSYNGYSSRRRRRRLSSRTETIKTETKLTNQTWVFNSAGLVWKY
jgi:hypothetical protein